MRLLISISLLILILFTPCKSVWGDSDIFLDTSRLIRVSGEEYLRERRFVLSKWGSKPEELFRAAKELSGIRRVIAQAIIARLEKPAEFEKFDADFQNAVFTWASPERFAMSGKSPVEFNPFSTLVLSSTRADSAFRKAVGKLPWAFRRRYYNGLVLNNTSFSKIQILEIALCGFFPSAKSEALNIRISEFGEIYRWLAWQVYLSQILTTNEEISGGLKLLEELCLETDVLDSPAFLFYVTDLALKHEIASLSIPINTRLEDLKQVIAYNVNGGKKTFKPSSTLEEIEEYLENSAATLMSLAKKQARERAIAMTPTPMQVQFSEITRPPVAISKAKAEAENTSNSHPSAQNPRGTPPELIAAILAFLLVCWITLLIISRTKRGKEY